MKRKHSTRRPSLARAALAVALSSALAIGGLPAPALAEAIEEAAEASAAGAAEAEAGEPAETTR